MISGRNARAKQAFFAAPVRRGSSSPEAAVRRARRREFLTYYAASRAGEALDLGDTLADALDAYTALITGQRRPQGANINTMDPTVHCLTVGDPDQPQD